MVAYRAIASAATLIRSVQVGKPQTCPTDLPLSCHNTTVIEDTCCFVPAGQLLQTQFWDTEPATGPSDSWTIHGLWPDNCDGTYPANCAPDRQYSNITAIIRSFNSSSSSSLLSTMETYWKDYNGDDESFWEHEWNKHGTCISTLEPTCYEGGYKPTQEVVDYFARTVDLFMGLPTYKWLSDAGIEPSDSATYDLEDVQRALEDKHGAEVTLGCKGKNLNEVWYHYNVRGSVQTGEFVAAEPDGTKGPCPSKVRYAVKGSDSRGGAKLLRRDRY